MAETAESSLNLPGTVKYYQRHLFVCTGQTDWPARIESGGGFIQTLAEKIGAYAAVMPLKVKLTACSDPGLSAREEQGKFDILVFPDMVRYVGLETADLEAFVVDYLVENRSNPRFRQQQLTGKHIFVCVHGRRDERCGQCGPPLAASLQAELGRQNLLDQVTLYQTSHVGGHAFAGNVLIYPGGDWYGFISPGNAPTLVEQHLKQGNIVWDLWRGRMGMEPETQMKVVAAAGL